MVTQLERLKTQPGSQHSKTGMNARRLTGAYHGAAEMEKRNADIVTGLFNEMASNKQTSVLGGVCLKPFCGLFETAKTVFSDYRVNLYSLIANGDCVTACYHISGAQRKDFGESHPPSMTISGIDMFRLDNGKIVNYLDINHQMKIQPGFNPSAALA
ncbi:MAG TPA: ester cyclase [Dehalococcoidales bacterium]